MLRLKVRACGRCGAVVTVSDGNGGGVDNEEGHAGWHRVQDDLTRAIADAVLELAAETAVMSCGELGCGVHHLGRYADHRRERPRLEALERLLEGKVG